MKKLTMFFAAIFCMSLLFVSCNSCKNEPEQKDKAIVITTDDFEEIIKVVVPAVNAQYPEYAFYEASGDLKKLGDKWGVDKNTFRAAFGCPTKIASVLAYVENDTLKFYQVDEPWLEDVYMSPYVPTDLNYGLEAIQKKVDVAFKDGDPVVLRHQLFPGCYEPELLVGTISTCHSVNVYSLIVDQPLKDSDKLVVEHTGLAAKK